MAKIRNINYNIVVFLTLGSIVFLLYLNTVFSPWVLDDYESIVNNPLIHLTQLNFRTLGKVFKYYFSESGYFLNRPISFISFALNWTMSGDQTYGYHFVNILIHILTAFVLYKTVMILLNLDSIKFLTKKRQIFFVAMGSAILWAINPIHVSAVTYIVQRMAQLSAFFSILSILIYLIWRREKKVVYLLISSFAYVLAVLSKQNAIILPLILLVIEAVFFDHKHFKIKHLMGLYLFFLTCLCLVLILKESDGLPLFSAFQNRPFTMHERVFTECRILIQYLFRIFFPIPGSFSPCHDVNIVKSPDWSLFVLVVINFIVILYAKKFPLICFPILFFFINHMIESSILPLELFFEHRNYLPSLFLFLPITWLAGKGIERFQTRGGLVVFSVFAGLAISIIGYNTYQYNSKWKTQVSLWSYASIVAPESARPKQILAALSDRAGYENQALQLNLEALSLRMESVSQKIEILNNIADIYLKTGQFQKALQYWTRALILSNGSVEMRHRVSLMQYKLDMLDEALSNVDKILQKKDSPETSVLKGMILLKKGEIGKADIIFKECLTRHPGYKPSILGMAFIAYEKKAYEESISIFKKLLAEEPKNYILQLWIIEANLRMHNLEVAEVNLKRVLKVLDKKEILKIIKTGNRDIMRIIPILPFSPSVLTPFIGNQIVHEKG